MPVEGTCGKIEDILGYRIMRKLLVSLLFVIVATAVSAAELRVMSYNIRLYVGKDGENSWEFRKYATPAMIYDIRPTVFGVQEAYRQQLDYIVEKCPGYKEVGLGREDGADKGEHMSVFYDSEILQLITWGNYWLSETPDRPSKGWDAACKRTATWVLFEIKSSGEKFYFVNTHLDHRGKEARKNGLRLIYDKIREMNKENYPMVLTGDFNVQPDNAGLADLNTLMKPARFNAQVADTVGSFNGWGKYGESEGAPTLDDKPSNTLLPIDYIYYAGFSNCLTFRVVRRQYAGVKYISDHYPVYADLVF